jgi:glyoxylase-like metal-dependent hydrolase (beta-lactamase superfamily II)
MHFKKANPIGQTNHAIEFAENVLTVETLPMNLEDHLGDIISKSRKCTGTTAAAAAKAAGISEPELASLEETGNLVKPVNFAALAPLLNLNAAKLEGISKGWLPSEKDLSIWRELRVITTHHEGMGVNAYLVWDEVSREAAAFDTGMNADGFITEIEQNQLQLRFIFLTHSHFDHIEGLAKLREKYPKAHLHSSSKGALPQQRNKANDFLHLGSLRITNRDTPGHSEDGVTYIVGTWSEDAPNVAFVGDAIFAGSMGNGFDSWDLAKQKVREQILSLPGDTLICPGHGPLTTVAEEKAHNPFF